MKKKENLPFRDAQPGERMIELKIRFWTNNLADGKGRIRPKHAWSAGVVTMERNQTHNIMSGKPEPFHTLMNLPAVLEKVLVRHGVTLHPSRRMRKLMSTEPINKGSKKIK